MKFVVALHDSRRWLKTAEGVWHCWLRGSRSTRCGLMNAEHLRMRPAALIAPVPEYSDGDRLCGHCRRLVGSAVVGVSGVLTTAGAGSNSLTSANDAARADWLGVLQRHFERFSARGVSTSDLTTLSVCFAELGAPVKGSDAQIAFEQLKDFLLRPTWTRKQTAGSTVVRTYAYVPHLKSAVSALHSDAKALKHCSTALEAWQRITGRVVTLDRCHVDRVISVMLQVPNPELYVTHLHTRHVVHLAAVWHPNTLLRAQREPALRGLFAGSTSYWATTKDKLNMLTD
jgi:hypothetical protein